MQQAFPPLLSRHEPYSAFISFSIGELRCYQGNDPCELSRQRSRDAMKYKAPVVTICDDRCFALNDRRVRQAARTSAMSLPMDALASPKSMDVLGLWKSAFSTPANPVLIPRLRTITRSASSTRRTGMP